MPHITTLGVPGIAVMDVVQLASSAVTASEKVEMLTGLVGARLRELRDELAAEPSVSFETPSSVIPPTTGSPAADRISDWAACSIWPARAGQPGLSSVSLPGNRFPAPPPSVLSRVFETDHFPLNPKNIKCRDWHMTLGCGLSLCCDLNEIRVFWHFTSFPNRVPACPSQDAYYYIH